MRNPYGEGKFLYTLSNGLQWSRSIDDQSALRSMPTTSNEAVGHGKGCNITADAEVGGLQNKLEGHDATYLATLAERRDQKNGLLIR